MDMHHVIFDTIRQHSQEWMRHDDLINKMGQIDTSVNPNQRFRTILDSPYYYAKMIDECVLYNLLDRKIEYTEKKGNPLISYRMHQTVPMTEIKKQLLEKLTLLFHSPQFNEKTFARLYIKAVTPKISYCSVRHDEAALLRACIEITDESLLGRLNELIEQLKKPS